MSSLISKHQISSKYLSELNICCSPNLYMQLDSVFSIIYSWYHIYAVPTSKAYKDYSSVILQWLHNFSDLLIQIKKVLMLNVTFHVGRSKAIAG